MIRKICIFYLFLLIVEPVGFCQWVQQQSNTTQHLFGVCMINANTGFIAGANQVVRKTTNGGLNWSTVSVPNWDYGEISFLNINTGIIAAGPGTIFIQTYNGGSTWIQRNAVDYIGKIQYIDSLLIYATGGYSVMKSVNGGINWFQIDTSSYYLNFRSLFFVNKDTGTVVGRDALVRTTTNGGVNWTTRIVGIPIQFGDSTLFDVMFGNAQTGYACGNNGIVIKTTNGGLNWNYKPTGTLNSLPGIYFTDANTGTVVGNPVIYRTINGGDNWISQTYPLNEPLRGVYFVTANTGWIAGFNGLILYTSNGGMVWLDPNSNNIPMDFAIYQNCPNPFNPFTKIYYTIPKRSNVTLVVYDCLGRQVKTLVNETKEAGYYNETLDGTSLASGIYFYNIEAGNYHNSKKMVLVK
jgi:photosystem II stability/assembly factor-like uncharacterized protein